MTKWLASVQSIEEANALLPVLPDILDMKDPSKGALGALNVASVAEIATMIEGRCLTSATIGDLPMNADLISAAMIEMADIGVDYVKMGLFPDANLKHCIRELENTVKALKKPVIAVIFADKLIKTDFVPLLKASGFTGVMVDTATKNGQNLLEHWDISTLTEFIEIARQQTLLCGLAGALRFEDIATLQSLGADYLGFRSALCEKKNRTSAIDINLVHKIRDGIRNIQ